MTKHSGKFVSYLRVSTKEQGSSGLGIEAQREAVHAYLNGGQWTLVGEVVEIESGKKADRPKLAEAMRLCRVHNAVLVIARLDRLSRNVAFVSALMESGVKFVAVDNPAATEFTVYILAAVAQQEAKAISERTKAALAAAKARGVKLGTTDPQRIKAYGDKGSMAARVVFRERKRKRAADLEPVIKELRSQGVVSQRGISAALNERGIPSARGPWSAPQVARLLASVAL